METIPSTSVEAPAVDLSLHLPLVGHVVRQLSLRLPAGADRTELWNLGAVGLAAAVVARRPGMGFGTLAMRSIRAHILDGARDLVSAPSDDALADLLGVSTATLVQARSLAVPTSTAPLAPQPQPVPATTGAPREIARPVATAHRRAAASIAYAS